MTATLLGVGPETLRYWRQQFPQFCSHSSSTSNDILCFRIIKFLTRHKYIPVGILKKFNWDDLIKRISSRSIPLIKTKSLILNEKDYSLRLVDDVSSWDLDDFHEHFLPLKPIVNEHIQEFLKLGEDEMAEHWSRAHLFVVPNT